MKRCLDCPALTTGSRCHACNRRREAARMARRAPSGWALQRRNRALIAEANGRCAICGGVGTEVDHIQRLEHGGGNERDNLRVLCHRCHVKVGRYGEGVSKS